jgi:hypothetical protein
VEQERIEAQEQVKVKIEHPVWLGVWLALGGFLFSLIVSVVGGFVFLVLLVMSLSL